MGKGRRGNIKDRKEGERRLARRRAEVKPLISFQPPEKWLEVDDNGDVTTGASSWTGLSSSVDDIRQNSVPTRQ